MIFLLRLLRGYLFIEISGENSERLLNLCAQNRIPIWNFKIIRGKIIASISVSGFRRLYNIRKKAKAKIKIKEKKGLPFTARKYRRRIGLFSGAVIFLVLLKILSSFVWIVNVEGNSAVSSAEILSACKKIGVFEGQLISKISTTEDAQQLLLNQSQLAWCSLNIEGCVLTVNVTEVKGGNNEKSPTNIKAAFDGIVKKIDATSGNVLVKVGDAVKQGDLLISGITEGLYTTEYVKSSGTVIAETERCFTASGNFETEKYIKEGKNKKRAVLSFLNLKIPLYLGEIRQDYLCETKSHYAYLFKKRLPISITVKNFETVQKRKVKRSKEELLKLLRADVSNQASALNLEEYSVISEEINDTSIGLELKITAKCCENISKEEKLLINTIN